MEEIVALRDHIKYSNFNNSIFESYQLIHKKLVGKRLLNNSKD